MSKKVKETTNQSAENYLKEIFTLVRKVETLTTADKKTLFNNTEFRMLGEIICAKYAGKRVISTHLAQILGVTRAAISQMVSRLEEQGVVKRVPDSVDRKIAYVELTEKTYETYRKDLEVYVNFVDRLVEKFGAERFHTMISLVDEFCGLAMEEKSNIAL